MKEKSRENERKKYSEAKERDREKRKMLKETNKQTKRRGEKAFLIKQQGLEKKTFCV